MIKKHITVLVSNDLEYDQRVRKVCETLLELGWDITLVGRKVASSKPFSRKYETVRFNLWFTKGAFFYAALNVRMFFYLLFKKTDCILANDLDTLLPAFLISKWRKKGLVYDSHEYFTEAEGLTGRAFQKNIWLLIERNIFPKLKHVITVNESIAEIYRNAYRVNVRVVRNIPELKNVSIVKTRETLGLPLNKRIVILQGAFIDPDRGGVEALEAMKLLDNVLLLIIGSGRDIPRLKEMAKEKEYEGRVLFFDKMPFDELFQYTVNADIGLSLDKPIHLNYRFSLPNKLFDYIHAGVPVLVSDLPELKRIVNQFHVGLVVNKTAPGEIANGIQQLLNDPQYNQIKENCLHAAKQLNWQEERKVLIDLYSEVALEING